MRGRTFGRDVFLEPRPSFQLNARRGRLQRTAAQARSARGRVVGLRIEDANRQTYFLVDDPHRLRQVGIVRDQHELIAVLAEGIDQHVRGDVHVRAFLFHLDDACEARRRRHERHRDFGLLIVAIMHCQIGQRLQRAYIELLALPDVWISGAWFHERREIADAVNVDAGQDSGAEGSRVDPFVRGVFRGSVVEVEAVNINVRRGNCSFP